MKIRGTDTENTEIKLNMVSMIDIVFQLLVFFIMTFKVVAMEGDFNVKMPLASQEAAEMEITPDLVTVRLNSGEEGVISSIEVSDGMNEEEFNEPDMFVRLTDFVEKVLASGGGDPSTANETEVEFDIAYQLKYSFTVKAIESVSGKPNPDGTIKKLVEKIKFKDNSKAE